MAFLVTLNPVPVALLQVKVSETSAVLLRSNAPVKVVAPVTPNVPPIVALFVTLNAVPLPAKVAVPFTSKVEPTDTEAEVERSSVFKVPPIVCEVPEVPPLKLPKLILVAVKLGNVTVVPSYVKFPSVFNKPSVPP